MSGSGISWAICKSASRCRQITMPIPHHSVFLQAGCPSCHPTNSVKALKARPTKLKWLQQQFILWPWCFGKKVHSSLESHGKTLEKECCLSGVFCDGGDTPANLLWAQWPSRLLLCCMYCVLCRQLAGSQWLEKKFIEPMLTEQLSSEDVRNRTCCLVLWIMWLC